MNLVARCTTCGKALYGLASPAYPDIDGKLVCSECYTVKEGSSYPQGYELHPYGTRARIAQLERCAAVWKRAAKVSRNELIFLGELVGIQERNRIMGGVQLAMNHLTDELADVRGENAALRSELANARADHERITDMHRNVCYDLMDMASVRDEYVAALDQKSTELATVKADAAARVDALTHEVMRLRGELAMRPLADNVGNVFIDCTTDAPDPTRAPGGLSPLSADDDENVPFPMDVWNRAHEPGKG